MYCCWGKQVLENQPLSMQFSNYLKFETLQQAEQGELTVLIPASFLITVGDQFNVFTVKFGTVDPNENDEDQGQSVTKTMPIICIRLK